MKTFWNDNAALMDEIGLKAEIGKITDNNISKDIRNKVSFLSGIGTVCQKEILKILKIMKFQIFILIQ